MIHCSILETFLQAKVRKTAKTRKQYNQVPHMTQDTTWESNKNTINITNKSQEASLFPAGNLFEPRHVISSNVAFWQV